MKNRSGLMVLFALVICSLAGMVMAAPGATNWQTKVHPSLLTKAATDQSDIVIYVTPTADLSAATSLQTKEEKGRFVYERLTSVAESTQPPVRQELQRLGVAHQSFWIANVITARANLAVIEAIAALPQVGFVAPVAAGGLSFPPQKPEPASIISRMASNAVEGGIASTNADDAWALGVRGQGVVVAGADTGVRWTHSALKNQYRGWNGTTASHDYNWKDGIHNPNSSPCAASSPEPCDDDTTALAGIGHGTHTMGTIVGWDGGANQIGMAPAAKWIACRNMNQGVGVPATGYLECMQFFLAPTKVDGTLPDPSKAPDVINNSWGCVEPGCQPEPNPPTPGYLRATLQASRAAGIVYVVSAGNEGAAGCSSLEFPLARYPESFTVGAIDHRNNNVASFSSRGPVNGDPDFPTGQMKPNITAPGVSIRSASRSSDTSYVSAGGTSMSGPHVAGLVALVISANPALRGDVDRIEEIIEQSAVKMTTSLACGTDTSTSVPNNVFGWGRIDALAAVNLARAAASGCLGPATGRFIDTFDPFADGAWTVDTAVNDAAPAGGPWQVISDPTAHSVSRSFFTADPPLSKDDRLVSPPQRISPTSQLTFWHSFNTEDTYDGGVLEVTTDGGVTWQKITNFVEGGYNSAFDPGAEHPLPGQAAWSGISPSYPAMNKVTANVGAWAGPATQFRWRFVSDALFGAKGWNVDDVEFTNLNILAHPPLAGDDTATTAANTAVTITVLSNDTQTGGGALDVVSATPGAQGTTTVLPNDTIVYTPNSGYLGADTFTYTVRNPNGCTDVGSVAITVTTGNSPGALEFSDGAYTVNEGGGSKTITVTRTGGSTGVVGASYTTTDGSAVEGADYQVAVGTATFGDGQTTTTFTVTINDDTEIEGIETVNLTLSDPSGDATLGTPSTAVLTIVDNDAPVGPHIDTISPASVCAGGPGFVLAIDGQNFTAATVVELDGAPRTTSLINPNTVNVIVRASDIATAGTLSVRATDDGNTSNAATLTVDPDTTGPVVTAPTSIRVLQSYCDSAGVTGASGITSSSVAAFIAGGSASDDCSPSTERLASQAGGQDVSNATVFRAGSTTVTFRFRDSAGNIGTATGAVTVRLFGDLNIDDAVDSQDTVIIANTLVGNTTAGTAPFTADETMADLNRDTGVDAVDYVILLNYLVGEQACLPAN